MPAAVRAGEPPGAQPNGLLGFREDGSAPPLAAFLEAFRLEDEEEQGSLPGGACKNAAGKLEASWDVFSNCEAFPGEDARLLSTGDLEECRAICCREGYGGFVYLAGIAYFRTHSREALMTYRRQTYGATLFVAPEVSKKARPSTGRFMALMADVGSEGFKAKQQEALERRAAREQVAQEVRAARERREAKANKRKDAAQAALRGCEASVSQAKIFAIVLAPCVASAEEAESLERCVRSVASQRCLPRTLWVSWFAESPELQQRVSASLAELAKRCVLKGMPVTQVQPGERLPPWRHVEGVLERRAEMGGDICDVWALLAYGDGLWHPERCARLSSAAAAAEGYVNAVWLPGACSPILERPCPPPADARAVDALLEEGLLDVRRGASSAEEAAADVPLVRMQVLADFIAGAPAPVLDHSLCDLAFVSFLQRGRSDGSFVEIECNDADPWTTFHADAHLGRPAGIARPAAEGALAHDPPAEERRVAMVLRRRAGDWALDLTAADFVRVFAAGRRGGEALALAALHGGDTLAKPTGSTAWPWCGVQEALGLHEDGLAWLQAEASWFAEEARQRLGEPTTPREEDLARLIPSSKLRASADAAPRPDPA